jgi:hydroxymethylpyrimidine/phosphomethylpyrimidine kinase
VAFHWLRDAERLQVGPVRGTGCALSSAIAAHLAGGAPLEEAVAAGRRFVADALRASVRRGKKAAFLVYA